MKILFRILLLGAGVGGAALGPAWGAVLTSVPMQGGMVMPELSYSYHTSDVDWRRHQGRSNDNFVDGHAETLALRMTYDPARHVDCWNPALAN